jgi:hypothetical protein
VKAILKVMVVWITLLAVPLQGFASATMSLCAPPAVAAQIDHDHASIADDIDPSVAHVHGDHAAADMQADDDHPPAHHHKAKCAACATCGACVSMAPSFVDVLPVPPLTSMTVPFDQQLLPSVDLALPERPPRA